MTDHHKQVNSERTKNGLDLFIFKFLKVFYKTLKELGIFILRLVGMTVILFKLAKSKDYGQWLWRSWQSGRFRHQRSAVRIPTSAIFQS